MTLDINVLSDNINKEKYESDNIEKLILLEIKELKLKHELEKIKLNNKEKQCQVSKLNSELENIKLNIIKNRKMFKNIDRKISYILDSKSWKITSPIRRLGRLIKK